MPGSASIDIILRMKNFPPTEAQLATLTSINFENRGQAPHTKDDLMFLNFGKRFDSDELIKKHHYGQVVLHFVSRENDWPKNPVAFAEYLKTNEKAFKRYRDVKVEGAELQKGKSAGDKMEVFRQYKMHKGQVALALTEEAIKWAYEDGNFSLPY